MKLSDIIKKNPAVTVINSYMETMTSRELAEIRLECPQSLKTIALKCPGADVVVFGDDSIGLELNGAIYAAEKPDARRGLGTQRQMTTDECTYLITAMA